MKGLDRLLWLCYGNHPKAGQQKEIAEELVLVLRNEEQMPRRELMTYLGFDPDDENEEQQFDRVLRKLRGDIELGENGVTAQVTASVRSEFISAAIVRGGRTQKLRTH